MSKFSGRSLDRMALRTHAGSCHCGAVRFEVELDLSAGTTRCNCSHCKKARTWFALVPPHRFRLVAGADAQTEYTWSPPGRGPPNLHFRFCRICGIRTPGYGEHLPPEDAPFYFIPIATLDGVDPAELAAAPVASVDGRHDRYDRPAPDAHLL